MKIGEALLKEELVTPAELKIALEEQKKTKERLGDIVIKMGFVNPENMAPFLAKYFSLPFIRLKDIYKEIQAEIIKIIPEELARRFTLIPTGLEGKFLTLAMYDPLDVLAVDTIKIKTGFNVRRVVAAEEEIIEALEYCYHQLPRMKEHIEDFIELETNNHVEAIADDSEKLRVEASDPPVVQYVYSLIVQAINNFASDVHIKPKQDAVELGFRIDGVLYTIEAPPKRMLPAINTRIKILANLDIAEHRLPQDGRFKIKVGISEIDIRVSCFPTIFGESIVMRLLDVSSPLMRLEEIGFPPSDLERYRALIRHSYGLILVTGPTGSGKTTTLYSSLNEIKSREKNMLTLEDPVEYRLPFLQQSQVNHAIGFDFARGLRSILRQDPDIIMVGEIRDKETAEIAIHAALTGHLVFSTLHTNDAAGAPIRLINMGVEPFLITSSLLGVLAQRLVRCVCTSCREEQEINNKILEKLGLKDSGIRYFRGKGCNKCLNSGYKGRSGVFELLIPNDQMRSLILSRCSSEELRQLARKNGMTTLRESGIEKLKSGVTNPDEILRVTQEAEEF